MIFVLRETHDAPPEVEQRLELAGGRNRFGEPNFRAVWGWSRFTWIGGKWEDRDAGGTLVREVVQLRQVPKYFPHDRWHIERWVPPELYGSPAEWHARTLEIEGGRSVPALGPYPARGEYEHCFTLEGLRGEFIQLTPTVAEYVARAIEFSRALPPRTRRGALEASHQREARDSDGFADTVLYDAGPAFAGVPFSTVPSDPRS